KKRHKLFTMKITLITISSVHYHLQSLTPARMSQLSQCFGLNLPDPLTGNAENFTHFLQGACPAVIQTESQAQYILLPVSQRIQHVFKLFLQELIRCMIGWALCFLVLYEIPQMAVILFTDWCFKGYRFLGNLEDFPDFFSRQVHFLSNFLRCRFTSEVLQQLTLYPDQFIDCFNHVDRDTDRPGLVGDGSCYRLSDPPCSISGEFESLGEIEFFNGFDQPHITFLDQVEKE